MCDYSLHVVSSRPAELAESIITADFFGTKTHGFASPCDPLVAVCLRPGTEIAFDQNVYVRGVFFRKAIKDRLARFRQIDLDKPTQHHDALEFANGKIVLVTDLVVGQRAQILQLPVVPDERPVTAKPAARTSFENTHPFHAHSIRRGTGGLAYGTGARPHSEA